tara:strand:+ start:194 stop:496 length:303 start_codon:yes stop_codon:yes gene_type:complete
VVVAEVVTILQPVEKMVFLEDQAVEQDMDPPREVMEILLLQVLLKDLMVEILLLLQDLLAVVVELVRWVQMVIQVQVIQQALILVEQVEQVLQQKLQQVQ